MVTYNLPEGRLGVLSSPNPSVSVLQQRLDAATQSLPDSLTPPHQPNQPPPAPTGVTAGTPGTVTPAGAVEASIGDLRHNADIGDTAKAGDPGWDYGEHVVILSTPGGTAWWDGTTWQTGKHVVKSVTPGSPGSFGPAPVIPPDLATLQAEGALGQTAAWTGGQHVILGDNSHAHWDGAAWAVGDAP